MLQGTPEAVAACKAAAAHVSLYGLTIAPVLGRVMGANTREARALLDGLVAKKKLFRHDAGRAFYYSAARKPLLPQDLVSRFAVLWFSCMSKPSRPLLPPERVREIAADACDMVGMRNLAASACYIEPPAICLLTVEQRRYRSGVAVPLDLERVLASLQRRVASPGFRPWLVFAAKDRFFLTVLLDGEEAAAGELSRWCERHPLVVPSPLPSHPEAIRVPVRVVPAMQLRGVGP